MEFKLLAICPTKGRPQLLEEMIVSFKSTTYEDSQLICSIDENDLDTKNILSLHNIPFIECNDMSVTERFNTIASEFGQRTTHFHLTNDDVLYKTQGWDELLCNQGISYGDDGLQRQNLCTFPVISSDIVNALGWLQQPRLLKLCGDVVWQKIGEECKCLNYIPEVKIEHRHFINNKRINDDENYNNFYRHDLVEYQEWLIYDSTKDIRTVNRLLYGHPNTTEVG